MSIVITLETEDGEILERMVDEKNLFGHIIPSSDNRSYELIKFIDKYGNSVFNRLQMESFQNDINIILDQIKGTEEQILLAKIKELSKRCLTEAHLYLKFNGD